MIKLTTFLFLCLFCFQLQCKAQATINVDYSAINEYVTNNSEDFQKLMQRFADNDSTLTHEDRALIYYGYSFTPAYKGSMDEYVPDFKRFNELVKEEKHEEAYEAGKEILKRNPVSLKLLFHMFALANELGKDTQEIKSYSKKYASLLFMITLSGDGKTEDTAFKVICVNDEYQVMRSIFRVENIKGQSLINNCDMIEFEKCKNFEGNQMYFDISRSLEQLKSAKNKFQEFKIETD